MKVRVLAEYLMSQFLLLGTTRRHHGAHFDHILMTVDERVPKPYESHPNVR
jgi:hypothetical protein